MKPRRKSFVPRGEELFFLIFLSRPISRCEPMVSFISASVLSPRWFSTVLRVGIFRYKCRIRIIPAFKPPSTMYPPFPRGVDMVEEKKPKR